MSGTVVLRFKTTVTELQSNVNNALGENKNNLQRYVDSAAEDRAATNDTPELDPCSEYFEVRNAKPAKD